MAAHDMRAGDTAPALTPRADRGAAAEPTRPDFLSPRYFGLSVAGAGDVNGDGFAGVVVGAPGESGGGHHRAFVFLGETRGLGAAPVTDMGGWGGQFGWSVL